MEMTLLLSPWLDHGLDYSIDKLGPLEGNILRFCSVLKIPPNDAAEMDATILGRDAHPWGRVFRRVIPR
jgi:hypothetical protein